MKTSKLFSYIVLIIMILIIIVVPFLKITTETNSDSNPNHYYITSFHKKLLVSGSIFIITVIFLFILRKDTQNFNQTNKQNVDKDGVSYYKPVAINANHNKSYYKKTAQDHTARELNKLYESKEFQDMERIKGSEKKNWVWETREKSKKSVIREKNYSGNNINNSNNTNNCNTRGYDQYDSDELDNLSQITMSDD